MARFSINVTLGPAYPEQRPGATAAGIGDALNTTAAVAAAAAGVAIGAGDASVENLATQAAVAALSTAVSAANLQVNFDNAVITTGNQFKAAMNAALQSAIASGRLTANS